MQAIAIAIANVLRISQIAAFFLANALFFPNFVAKTCCEGQLRNTTIDNRNNIRNGLLFSSANQIAAPLSKIANDRNDRKLEE